MQSILHKVVGPKEVHPVNLDGRVAVVTGGALGIGYRYIFSTVELPLTFPAATKLVARLPSLA